MSSKKKTGSAAAKRGPKTQHRAFVQSAVDAMLDLNSPEYKKLVEELRAVDSQRIQSAISNSLSCSEYAKSLAQRRAVEDLSLDRGGAGAGKPSDEKEESERNLPQRLKEGHVAVTSRPLESAVIERAPGMLCAPSRYACISYENLQRSVIDRNVRRHIADAALWDLYIAYTNVAVRDAVACLATRYLRAPDSQTLHEANSFLGMRAILLCTVLANLRRCVVRGERCEAVATSGGPSIEGPPLSKVVAQTISVQGEGVLEQQKLMYNVLLLICTAQCDVRAERFAVPEMATVETAQDDQQPLEHVAEGEAVRKNAPQVRSRSEWIAFSKAHMRRGAKAPAHRQCLECNLCGRSFVFSKKNELAARRAGVGPLPGDAWPSTLYVCAQTARDAPLLCLPVCSLCASGVLAYDGLFRFVERAHVQVSKSVGADKRAALALIHSHSFIEELQSQLREQFGTIRILLGHYTQRAVHLNALRCVRSMMSVEGELPAGAQTMVTTVQVCRDEYADQQLTPKGMGLMQVSLCVLEDPKVSDKEPRSPSRVLDTLSTASMPLLTTQYDETRRFLNELERHVATLQTDNFLSQTADGSIQRAHQCAAQITRALDALNNATSRISEIICARGAKRSNEAMRDTDTDTIASDDRAVKRKRRHARSGDANAMSEEDSPIVIM